MEPSFDAFAADLLGGEVSDRDVGDDAPLVPFMGS
jgi:hypothetical protein